MQGVEKNKIIPHHKIEKLIVVSKIPFTFLRPAYFMQNFTTTLSNDILNNLCLLYTSDAADERSSVDLGGRRIIKKKNKIKNDNGRKYNEKTT